MKRSRRMVPVLNLARREEEAALRLCGQAQQTLDDALAKLEQLQDYCVEYRQRLDQTGTGVDLARLQSARHFLERLHDARRQQQAEVERLRQQQAQIRAQWLKTRHHSESLNKLTAEYRREEDYLMARKSQALADDLSGQRLAWVRADAATQAMPAGEKR